MGQQNLPRQSTASSRYLLRSGTRQTSDTRTSYSSISANSALANVETYVHSPLNTSKNEIRILKLDSIIPGTTSDQKSTASQENTQIIHGSIYQAPLEEAGAYTALSYTWGEPALTPWLFIDGKAFSITKNLYDALLHLHRASIICLWIDAICINQKDDKERSQQVQRMTDIYRMANEVVAWIGMHDNHSVPLFQWIKTHHSSDILAEKNIVIAPMLKQALNKLARRPYWRRVWIVQELAVAREVRIMCGDDFMDAELLCELSRRHVEGRDKSGCHLVEPLLNMIQIRQYWQKGVQPRLLSLMRYTSSMFDSKYNQRVYRTFKSTELIDQIHGLLGLVSDGKQFVPEPDYGRTMNELFEYMTRSIITDSKRLDFAFLEIGTKVVTAKQCGSTKPRVYKPAELPSWCPDYLNLLDSATNSELTYSMDVGLNPSENDHGTRHRYVERVVSWNATAGSLLVDINLWPGVGRRMSGSGVLVGKVLPCLAFKEELLSSRISAGQNTACTLAGLNQLLFTYAQTPLPSLTDAIEAMSFVLQTDISDVILCCDPGRHQFRKRIREQYPDELVWLAATLIKTQLKNSKDLSAESWHRIHGLAHELGNSVMASYSDFRRKVAAYQPNEDEQRVITVAEEQGRYAWVPVAAEPDDEIWLLKGCSMPIVLRRRPQSNDPDANVFVKVGPTVVNGAMYGEMWSEDNLTQISIA